MRWENETFSISRFFLCSQQIRLHRGINNWKARFEMVSFTCREFGASTQESLIRGKWKWLWHQNVVSEATTIFKTLLRLSLGSVDHQNSWEPRVHLWERERTRWWGASWDHLSGPDATGQLQCRDLASPGILIVLRPLWHSGCHDSHWRRTQKLRRHVPT